MAPFLPFDRLFFIRGFDPRSSRLDHRRLRRAATQRPMSDGVRVSVGERRVCGPIADAWSVRWQPAAGQPHESDHSVLRWDDLARARAGRRALDFWRAAWRVWVIGYVGVAWWGIWRRSKPGMALAAAPIALALALMLGGGVAAFALLRWGGLAMSLSLSIALICGWLLWRLIERRLDSAWMLRLLAFGVDVARGRVAGYEQRLDAMAACVRQGCTPDRPVRVVGHSVGSYLAVSVVARALKALPSAPGDSTRIELLTLGHDIPLLAVQPQAAGWCVELAAVAADPRVDWLDVSAVNDWAAFGRCPPWAGLALPAGALRVQRSPRFHAVLTPAHYARVKRDKRALHLQYLQASDHLGGYDWLALCAAPQLLRTLAATLQPSSREAPAPVQALPTP